MWACHRAWSRQCANNKEVTQRVTESLPSIIQIKLEQKLQASNIAHQTALNELDSAQRDYSSELQKVSKLQAERRSFLTLKEEIEIEKDAKRDLANENALIKGMNALIKRSILSVLTEFRTT